MLYLIPRPLHRAGLRLAYRLRHYSRYVFKPRLRGVSVAVTDLDGRLLLVRHSYGSGAWTLPGGGCGRGEEPEAAAQREIREELGIGLTGIQLLSASEETISGAPHMAYLLAAQLEGSLRPDGREILEARFFAPDALPDGLSALTRARIVIWLGQAADTGAP